jgi:phosphoglycerate dehydrogenase-like enzyme
LAAFEEIKPEGVEIAWVNSDDSIEDQAAQMQDAVALIVAGRGRPTVELAAKCSNLRLIQTTSAGTDYLDKVGLGELGISVSNNGGGNAVAVAEHTMGLIVSTIRKLQLQFNAVSLASGRLIFGPSGSLRPMRSPARPLGSLGWAASAPGSLDGFKAGSARSFTVT